MTTDLVGVSEIAARMGVRRSAVSNWTTRHDDFPDPVVRRNRGSVWKWEDVKGWLISTGRLSLTGYRYGSSEDVPFIPNEKAERLTVPVAAPLREDVERQPIKCQQCGEPVLIVHRRTDVGGAAVRPGAWFLPASRTDQWEAVCLCGVSQHDTEGDLYRSLGLPYA